MQKYELYMKEVQTFDYKGTFETAENVQKFCCEYLNLHMSDRERCYVIGVNNKGMPIGVHELSVGGISSSIIEIPIIFKFLITCNAPAFFLVHNHPSGDTEPSREDIETSQRVADASKIIGINFVDHIIVGPDKTWASMRNKINF